MARFSIGHINPYSDAEQTPVEMVQVEAPNAKSAVTRIINTGDDVAHDMAAEEQERIERGGQAATPVRIAAGIAGPGATVNPVD